MASEATSVAIASQEEVTLDQGLLWELALFAITVVLTIALRSSKAKSKQTKSKSKLLESEVARATAPKTSGLPAKKNTPSSGSPTCSSPARQMSHSIHTIMTLMEGQPSLRTLYRAMEIYSKLRETGKQQHMHAALEHSGHTIDQFYNVMLQIASRLGQMDELDAIMEDMAQANVQGSMGFYENAMKLLASHKQYQLALNVYDRLVAADLEPSTVTWSCLVGFAAEVGNFDLAVTFFEKLTNVTTPSIRAYMTILRVHGKRHDWAAASAIFQDMKSRGAAIDGPILNLILATGVAVDKVEAAQELLTSAEAMSPPVPDTVSYNTLVKGYAQRNDAINALKTVCRMKKRGLPCTSITFNTALDAAFRASKPAVALEVLSSMDESGLLPDKFTCTILMKGVSRNPTRELIQKCSAICGNHSCKIDASLRSKLQQCISEARAKITSVPQRTATPPWRQ